MHPPGADTVVVRLSGEIGVKSRTVQFRMERTLQSNLESMLETAGFADPVEHEHTRLYVRTEPDRIGKVTDVVTDTFGIVSASAARQVEPTLDAINAALESCTARHYDGGTFAVRARRAGDETTHPFTSEDIQETGGEAVWNVAEDDGLDPTVDLDEPDLTFHVECRPDRAFVFLETQQGPGGLPYGTQEPVVALVSGGIDSPVAAWKTMKRGCPIYPLYIDLGEYGGIDHRLRAEETVRTLGRYVPDGLELRIVPGGDGLERIVESTDSRRMLVARRFMFRVAEHVADSVGAVGIVTGESIGQKSSQTSANLHVTSAVTDVPVHRPLISMDKAEITRIARDIGTYGQATIDAGCNRLAPDRPATRPPLSTVRDVEPDDIDRLARDAAEGAELLDVSTANE